MTDDALTQSVAPVLLTPRTFMGHPVALGPLFFTEMWERFTYYGMRALLILFMTAAVGAGGRGMSAEQAGVVYGLFTAGVYLFSVPGGWIADRLIGQRRSVLIGGLLIAAGNLMAASPGAGRLFYFGLLVIALGVGLLKPNISVMVGQLYRGQNNAQRDAGFSIFYFGISLGALTAPLVAGTIGELFGFRWGFVAAGAAMMLGVAIYVLSGPLLAEVGLQVEGAPAERRRDGIGFLAILGIGVILAGLLFSGVLSVDPALAARMLGVGMGLFALGFFGYLLLACGLDRSETRRIAVIALMFLCGCLFPAGLEQAGSTMNLFARDYTDRSLLGGHFAAGQHPASWYQSIEPILVVCFAPLFALLWLALGRRGRNPSTLVKFGIALLLLGASFAVMAVAIMMIARTGQKASPAWLLAIYLLQCLAELCCGPVGLASITRLAPPPLRQPDDGHVVPWRGRGEPDRWLGGRPFRQQQPAGAARHVHRHGCDRRLGRISLARDIETPGPLGRCQRLIVLP